MGLFSLCLLMGKGVREQLGSLCKGTNPMHEGPTSMTQSPPNGSPPNTIELGIQVSPNGSVGDANIQPLIHSNKQRDK